MSVDSYFCMCCLSTDDLHNLCDKNQEISYTDCLKEFFNVILMAEEVCYDDYICTQCANSLKQCCDFKKQVFKSIDTLKSFGLITTQHVDGNLLIKKVRPVDTKEIYSANDNESKKEEVENVRQDEYQPNQPITLEQVKNNQLENVEVTKNIDIIHSFLANDPVKELERDGDISVRTTEVEDWDGKNDLKCKICMETLPNSYVFNTHINKHFPNFVCEECGRGFISEKRLKRHKYSHNRGPFVCQHCGQTFHKYSTYDSHRKRKHATKPPYACAHCSRMFATHSQRARHALTEHDVAPRYSCAQCDASFITSGYLNTHIRYKHKNVKRYFCELCAAGFYHKTELEGHSAAHSGKNPYKCHLCSKSYLRKKALIVHLKLHTDDKRFCCHVCGKRFLQKCTLTTHAKIHNRTNKTDSRAEKSSEGNNLDKVKVDVIEIEIEPIL